MYKARHGHFSSWYLFGLPSMDRLMKIYLALCWTSDLENRYSVPHLLGFLIIESCFTFLKFFPSTCY